jgi:tRNA-specific 2-thiouridylase
MNKAKVAVALSGGVDSSVAALLLKETDYEVMGIHMRLRDSTDHEYQAHRAEDICRILNIPYCQVDMQKEFESSVVDYFCWEYRQGRTPNPCVACNQHIKFGFLLDKTSSLGADYLATGHYARVEYYRDGYGLLKATDVRKDQSYFLYTLTQERLEHVLFPLGGHSKDAVKQMAKQAGLPAAAGSSQDICFISQKNYDTFLNQRFSSTPGDIVDISGRKLGQHHGIAFYTIGQRHGLGLASSEPLFVTRIEREQNKIVLGYEKELYSRNLTAQKPNWISGKPPVEPIAVTARIRYKSKDAEAIVFPHDDSVDVNFARPQKAVTPGQAIVFYNVDEVLGGGTIESAQSAAQGDGKEGFVSVSKPR